MNIIKAILKINPNAEFTINADDINQITWHNGTTPISKSDIEAQFPAVELDNAMRTLRTKRNQLLQDTDFHALSDQTLSTEMATYRTNLRNITNGITTVDQANNVTWPTKPSE